MPRAVAPAAISVERFFQFSVWGLVASGFLALVGSGYLDLPSTILAGAGLLLRALAIQGLVRLDFSERAVSLLTAGYAAFYAADYLWLSREFLPATVHLVLFIAVLKVLTARSGRDHLYTAIAALLELLAAAMLSINFNFIAFLALFLVFAAAALMSGEIRRSMRQAATPSRMRLRRFHPRLAILSGLVAAGILVLTAGLFFILPRTADAALARLIEHRIYVPGFSNEVTLGEIGAIKTTSRPMMHIRIFSREPASNLKWRGGALAIFDGKRWTNPAPAPVRIPVDDGQADVAAADSHPAGRRLNYHVEFDEIDTDALFFAGSPEKVDLHAQELLRTREDTYRLPYHSISGFHYDAYSLLEDPPETAAAPDPAPVLAPEDRARYLELPRLDPRIAALARSFTAGAAADLERARAIERRLRTGYGYTLDLPKREPADPLAWFLFTRKKGYCEYFASAMAVMLRSVGIPSRLATGFQSGTYNPISDLWVVRASDAHAWVEAWMPGYGWTTFDPTPPDPHPPGFALLARLGMYLDAAETFWQQWVVGYNIGRQGSLADRAEQAARRMGIRWFDSLSGIEAGWDVDAVTGLKRFGLWATAVLLAGVSLCFAGPRMARLLRIRVRVLRVRRGQANVGDATLLYGRMLHILKRRGFQKPVWFTPAEFAASLAGSHFERTVAEFTATYNALRFGRRTGVAPRLSALLDELERQ